MEYVYDTGIVYYVNVIFLIPYEPPVSLWASLVLEDEYNYVNLGYVDVTLNPYTYVLMQIYP